MPTTIANASAATKTAIRTVVEAAAVNLLAGSTLPVRGCMLVDNGDSTSVLSATGNVVGVDFIKVPFTSITPTYDTDSAADTVNSQIVIPSWVNFVNVTGHATFPPQNTSSTGECSVHLFRGDAATTDAHYHVRAAYIATANAYQYTSITATTGWIPVQTLNETWQLYVWQNSGAAVVLNLAKEYWLNIQFSK